MKKNFYTTLLIGLGLAFASIESFAKSIHIATKKTVSVASKHDKTPSKKADTHKKSEAKTHASSAASKDKHAKHNGSGKKQSVSRHAKNDGSGKKSKNKKSYQYAKSDGSGRQSKNKEFNKYAKKEENSKLSQYSRHNRHDRRARHSQQDELELEQSSDSATASLGDDDRVHHMIVGKNASTKKAFSADESPALGTEWGLPFVLNNSNRQSSDSTLQLGSASSNESKLPSGDNGASNNVLQTQSKREDDFAEPKENNSHMHTLIGTPAEKPGGATMSAVTGSVHVVFDDSVSLSHQASTLSKDMVAKLAEIFAWDVDFANSIHPGDKLTVVYEKDSEGNNASPIIAAQFVSGGKSVTAIRYRTPEGKVDYYSPEGKSLRKAFLSSPVDYIKISSHFDPHRRHPILNRIRAHKGVDYAARTGTPVKAAGDGSVSFVGNQGGYGQIIILEHGAHYETVYAHLSRFKQGLQSGDPVRQGEVIGFVGQTGLATGPHLHYEFRVDGVHQNPESVTTGESLAIENRYWSDFHSRTVPVLTQLNQAKTRTVLADNLE